MNPSSADNIVSVCFAVAGAASCVRMLIRFKHLKWLSVLALLTLILAGFTQLAVIFGFNRVIGNDLYEIASDLLIMSTALLVLTRRTE